MTGTPPLPPVGTTLPPLERRVRLVDVVAYAGATWDWHPLHYDRELVAELGLPAPVVDGQALGAYLAEQVLDHLGPDARIRRMAFRFRAMVFAGETVRVEGEVTDVTVEDDATRVTVTQRVVAGDRVAIDGARTEALVRSTRAGT